MTRRSFFGTLAALVVVAPRVPLPVAKGELLAEVIPFQAFRWGPTVSRPKIIATVYGRIPGTNTMVFSSDEAAFAANPHAFVGDVWGQMADNYKRIQHLDGIPEG